MTVQEIIDQLQSIPVPDGWTFEGEQTGDTYELRFSRDEDVRVVEPLNVTLMAQQEQDDLERSFAIIEDRIAYHLAANA